MKKKTPLIEPVTPALVIPDHREDIQAPYFFTPDEKSGMNISLLEKLNEIEDLDSQRKSSAADFKLRIESRKGEAKILRNKLASGEETRAMTVAVDFDPKARTKRYLDVSTGAFIRQEPMQPADFQLPLFRVETPKAPEKAAPEPGGNGAKEIVGITDVASATPSALPPEHAGKTNLGDVLDREAALKDAALLEIDLAEIPNRGALQKRFHAASKKAGWSEPQIGLMRDLLRGCADVPAMVETLATFAAKPE